MGWWNWWFRGRSRGGIPVPPDLIPEEGLPSFPSWKQKQQILYGKKANREERLRIARELLQGGRATEAMEYLEVEKDPELLRSLLDRALETGDAFLYRRAAAALGIRVPGADWERLAERAESLGKGSFARMARAAAGEGEGAPKVKAGKGSEGG